MRKKIFRSAPLERDVEVDFYLPLVPKDAAVSLLLVNDGQDLVSFHFQAILDKLFGQNDLKPLLVAGIHCGPQRKMEYGTVKMADYKKRGSRAENHQQFVFEELLPFIRKEFSYTITEYGYAGFSLGGLSAFDTVWHYPELFSKTGVFSGSLWWRLKGLDDGYVEETDRIIHKLVREGDYKPGLKFYFTTGSLDEEMDRNKNGVIDSIDDTLGLIEELEKKGYRREKDIKYINYDDGKHDVKTWGRAMPDFLKWGWGNENL